MSVISPILLDIFSSFSFRLVYWSNIHVHRRALLCVQCAQHAFHMCYVSRSLSRFQAGEELTDTNHYVSHEIETHIHTVNAEWQHLLEK